MPDTLHRALDVCDKQLFSKVHHLLKLERILHVTRCEVERSFCCIQNCFLLMRGRREVVAVAAITSS